MTADLVKLLPEPVHGYLVAQWQNVTHKAWVAYYMLRLFPLIRGTVPAGEWLWRAVRHDWTKFKWDEAKHFARTVLELRDTEYGSGRYRALLGRIKPAIDLHYARWDHHPEHYEAGALMVLGYEEEFRKGEGWDRQKVMASGVPVSLMTPICQAEMLCDWAAATRRMKNGDLRRSIEANQERFGYGPELRKVLEIYAARLGL